MQLQYDLVLVQGLTDGSKRPTVMNSLPDLSSIITENVRISPIFFPETPSPGSAREPDNGIIYTLTQGMKMTKIPNKSTSRPKIRFIKVDLEPLQIDFESKNGSKGIL